MLDMDGFQQSNLISINFIEDFQQFEFGFFFSNNKRDPEHGISIMSVQFMLPSKGNCL